MIDVIAMECSGQVIERQKRSEKCHQRLRLHAHRKHKRAYVEGVNPQQSVQVKLPDVEAAIQANASKEKTTERKKQSYRRMSFYDKDAERVYRSDRRGRLGQRAVNRVESVITDYREYSKEAQVIESFRVWDVLASHGFALSVPNDVASNV